MAVTPTPKSTANNPCAAALADATVSLPLGVAFSGGADSTALLLAAQARWPGQVVALHVHHGIQAVAEDFVRHCQDFCEARHIPLFVAYVDGRHELGESPEDAARKARYGALADLAQSHQLAQVALGQHADDQIETLLLALSRGAGLPGLAGMAAHFTRHGVAFIRPLLALSAQDIRAWLVASGVAFIEDPSNGNTDFVRNRIRHQVLPTLAQAFPQYRVTFTRSMAHLAQAEQLLRATAAQDLQTVGIPPQIALLQAFSPERQANLLRHWLKHSYGVVPSTVQLTELQKQLMACRTRGHNIQLKLGEGFVRRQGRHLAWYNR